MGQAIRKIIEQLRPNKIDFDRELSELKNIWFTPTWMLSIDNTENIRTLNHLVLNFSLFREQHIKPITDRDRVETTKFVDGKYMIKCKLLDSLRELEWQLKDSLLIENDSLNKALFLCCFLRTEQCKKLLQFEIIHKEHNPAVFISKLCDQIDFLSVDGLWSDMKFHNPGSSYVNGTRCTKDLKSDVRSLGINARNAIEIESKIKWETFKNVLLEVTELPIFDYCQLDFADVLSLIDALKDEGKNQLKPGIRRFFAQKWNRKIFNILFHTLSQAEDSIIPISQHNTFLDKWDKLKIDKMGRSTVVSYLGKKKSRTTVQMNAYKCHFMQIRVTMEELNSSEKIVSEPTRAFLEKIKILATS